MSSLGSVNVRHALFEHVASQVENGLSTIESLEKFAKRMTRKGKTKAAESVTEMTRAMRNGKTFSDALGADIPSAERSIIAASEETGGLVTGLQLILTMKARETRIRRAVGGALLSPVVNGLSLWGCLWVIGAMLNPQFLEAVPLSRWTGWAYAMYLMGEAAVSWYGVVFWMVLFSAIVLAYVRRDKWVSRGRAFADKWIFPVTLFREVDGFVWLMTFVGMLQAKVPDTNALRMQIEVASPYVKSRLRPVLARMRNGMDLPDALRTTGNGFPSEDLIDEIGAYAGFPNFAAKVAAVGEKYAAQMEMRLLVMAGLSNFIFTTLVFLAMGAVQLGANELQTAIMSTFGV
jgi:type II secretory pathway component PulF